MKRTIILSFVLLLASSHISVLAQQTLCTPKPSKEAVALYKYLLDMKGKKILSGQMWSPWGIDEIKYLLDNTGKLPAIKGLDFIDQKDNENEVRYAIEWWKAGGIPTIMWHWGAPGIGEGYENSKKPIDIDKCFQEGTPEYKSFWLELKNKADLLEKTRDANVPIIWRPYHELNGNWFWWGKQGPEKFKKLWITMYNYFVKDRGLNNLIWVLCYTGQPDAAWYPGDQYVDIAGADTYKTGDGPQMTMYNKVKEITKDKFPIAYHECGIPPNPDQCLSQGGMWSWWMEWHTSWLEGVDKTYLKYVYNHDLVITRDEVPDIMAKYGANAIGQKISAPSDKKATPETVALFQSILKLEQKGIMYGHQDDLMYGRTWWYEKDRSDTKDFTGEYPAVAGFELGNIELGDARSLDSVEFKQIAEQIKAQYKRGGIITISWHLNNPLTIQLPESDRKKKPTAWDVSSKEVVASILPTGANYKLYNTWLERLATFFKGLKDDKGTPIPFIFRPYHEHSGSFFWWGSGLCSDEQYASLWRNTVEFLRDKKGIHNILYAYNTDRVTSLEQYLKGYPGDDIIDMLSYDMYDRGEQFNAELDQALKFVSETAIAKKKLCALSETGERRGMTDWWSKVLLPVVSKYQIAYVLTWRHRYDSNLSGNQNPSTAFPADFMNFYNSPGVLFLNKVQKQEIYKKAVK